jgi:ATP-dependent Clp protease ATP-binding subunit ClpA
MNPEGFRRLDEDAKKIIVLARDEVERYRHVYLKPEHLLLAVLHNMQPSTLSMFSEKHVDTSILERKIRRSFKMGTRRYDLKILLRNPQRGVVKFSKTAATALTNALNTPDGQAVTPTEILHGILRNPSSLLRQILKASKQPSNRKLKPASRTSGSRSRGI